MATESFLALAGDVAGIVIPPPFDKAFSLLRSLWTAYNDLGRVLDAAKEAATCCSSLVQLLESLAGRPDLLKLVAPQAASLTALLESAQAVAREAAAADASRHGSWGGWVRAVVSSPFANSSALALKVADISTHLTQATAALSAAIGVQTYAALASGVEGQAASGAAATARLGDLMGMVASQASQLDSQASQLDKLNAMVEKLTLALAHEGATPAASTELAWLKSAAAEGAADPHSSMVSYALKNSRDLYAEVEATALAKFLGRGLSAAANSLVSKAPILQLGDLAGWSLEGAQVVGAGSYGHVRKGVLAEFGLPVAVKTLPPAIVAEACKSEARLAHLVRGMRREADIQFTLRDHSGVATVYGILLDVKEHVLGLVMELAEGDLHGVLADRQGHPDLPITVRVALLEQVASALAVMHRRTPPMLHGDVKSANVLIKAGVALGASGCAMLTDFGMARVEAELTASTTYLTNSVRSEGVGTPLWKAPELFGRKKEQPSEASDTYAFGMLMFEVLTRALPFEGEVFEDESSLVELLKEGGRPDTVPEGAFKQHVIKAALRGPLVGLMRSCWDGDKAKRPRMGEVALALREELAELGGAVADAVGGGGQSAASSFSAIPSSGSSGGSSGSVAPSLLPAVASAGASAGAASEGSGVVDKADVRGAAGKGVATAAGTPGQRAEGGRGAAAQAATPAHLPVPRGVGAGAAAGGSSAPVYPGWTGGQLTGYCVAQLKYEGKATGGGLAVVGGQLVSGGVDGHLRVWDLRTGQNVATMAGRGYRIAALPGGRFATATGFALTAAVWDAATATRICELKGHTADVNCVAAVPGDLVATGSYDETVRIWHAATGAHVATLEGHKASVSALAMLPDGRLASGGADETVRLWDLSTRACTAVLQHADSVYALAALDGGCLASGCDDSNIYLWNPTSGTREALLKGHTDSVLSLAALPQGLLASGSSDMTVRVWNVAARTCGPVLRGHTSLVTGLVALPDGRFASGTDGDEDVIRVWELQAAVAATTLGSGSAAGGGRARDAAALAAAPTPVPAPHGVGAGAAGGDESAPVYPGWTGGQLTGHCVAQLKHGGDVSGLAVVRGMLVSGGEYTDHLHVWDPRTGQIMATMAGAGGFRIAALSGGRFATAADFAPTAAVWDAATATRIYELQGHRGCGVYCVASVPGDLVATGGSESTVCIWHAATGAHVATLEGHTSAVLALAILPDGLLASGGFDCYLRLWDLSTRTCSAVLLHDSVVFALAALEGGCLASGCGDNMIYLWNTTSGEREAQLEGHTDAVVSLAALPQGLLASGSDDKTVRVWNVAARNCVAVLQGHTAEVYGLATLPDGRLASGSKGYDDVIRVWELRP